MKFLHLLAGIITLATCAFSAHGEIIYNSTHRKISVGGSACPLSTVDFDRSGPFTDGLSVSCPYFLLFPDGSCNPATCPVYEVGHGTASSRINSDIDSQRIFANGLATASHIAQSSHESDVTMEIAFEVLENTPYLFFGSFRSEDIYFGSFSTGGHGFIELRDNDNTILASVRSPREENLSSRPSVPLPATEFTFSGQFSPGNYALTLYAPASSSGREIQSRHETEFDFQLIVPEPQTDTVFLIALMWLTLYHRNKRQ